MEFIDLQNLDGKFEEIKKDYLSKKPFKYTIIENFLKSDKIEDVYQSYPDIKDGIWDGTTYIDQQNKFQKTKFEKNSVMDRIFKELNSEVFTQYLEKLSGIEDILGDDELVGGGLHQSIKGAFLNVHVDYNIHPFTKLHRRLNVLVYLNKNWKDEYEGHLQLWDLTGRERILLETISPIYNRAVIFETNELSFHGHPKSLNTPDGITRKSLATYYYTKTRPAAETASEHSTIYVNTEGTIGQVRRFNAGVKAFLERINKKSK